MTQITSGELKDSHFLPEDDRVGNAGASAQRRYKLQKSRRLALIRRRLPWIIPAALASGAISWVVADQWSPQVGPWAVLGASWAVGQLWPKAQPTEAWRKGAEGERRTAKKLGTLGSNYIVLHDRQIRGRRSNIDHVVIGPSGVFAIETKNTKGEVTIKQGHLFQAGHNRDNYVEEVWCEAGAVQAVLAPVMAAIGADVVPVICFHGAELPWGKSSIESVRIVGGRGLLKLVRSSPKTLSPAQVKAIAAFCDQVLKRA